MNCPRCSGRAVGRIGSEHYYCWECCVEFNRSGGGWQVYAVDDEGQLVPVVDEAAPLAAVEAPGTILTAPGAGPS